MVVNHAKRILLISLMGLAAVNLFTGAPLFAVWVGSRVQGDSGGLTMTAVFVVILVMALGCWALIWALNVMGDKHDELVGRPAGRRRQSPWMKPFNSPTARKEGVGLRAIDKVLVCAVVLAGLAFEAWFFFFAGSSIGH
jgi:hypothetical protein